MDRSLHRLERHPCCGLSQKDQLLRPVLLHGIPTLQPRCQRRLLSSTNEHVTHTTTTTERYVFVFLFSLWAIDFVAWLL
jgi:hypothetical protein